LAVLLQPDVEPLQRGVAQGVDATLRVDAGFHQVSVAENAQVPGDLRLTETQAMDHVTDGARAGAQEFDDMKTVGLCQSFESIEHHRTNGNIYVSRNICVEGEEGWACEPY
jgi:hypothetical protein